MSVTALRTLALAALTTTWLFGCASEEPTADADASSHRDASLADASSRDAAGSEDAAVVSDAAPSTDADITRPIRVSVFSRTEGYRHASIADGLLMLDELADTRGWTITATEDPDTLEASLASADVVVFLSTTGDVLDASQETALEAFVRGGGGFVGIHSAADTEYDWPFYGELLGTWFLMHPAVQQAMITVEDRSHPATGHLDATWTRTDEWYDFRENPRATTHVLLTVDESTYAGGTMGADHPVAWSHAVGAGRSFYTALGHTEASYGEPAFRAHVAGAIVWAAGR